MTQNATLDAPVADFSELIEDIPLEEQITLRQSIHEEVLGMPGMSELVDRLAGKKYHIGRNRVAVFLKRTVLKLPRCWDGFTDNDWEGSVSNGPTSRDHIDYVQYPHTRLVYMDEVPLVFMELVRYATSEQVHKHLGTEEGEYNWTDSVDGGQVGFTHRGRLVAFDYGPR